MAALLSLERRGAVALVTLRRPEKRNALSIALRLELADALERLGGDEDVGCVVLTGAGTAFCSGMDTTEFGGDEANRRALLDSTARSFAAVARCRQPVVVAVNGPAIAGGFALALLCDVRIAAESASFGFPGLALGIPASYAACRAVLGLAAANELCLTGRVIDAAEARALGAVGEVVPAGAALGRALEVADGIARSPRWAVLETKRRILLDAERTWLPLLDDELAALERALRERSPDPAA